MKNFNVKLDPEIVDDIKKCAKKANKTQAAWIRLAIRNQKAKDERKAKK